MDLEPPSFEKRVFAASRSVRASALLMFLRVRDTLLEPLRDWERELGREDRTLEGPSLENEVYR